MNAEKLKAQIAGGEAKLGRAKAEAAALPQGRRKAHLEHLIKGAERGLVELRVMLAGMEAAP